MYEILIVEDEPAMRVGLRDNLEYEGYRVTEAADGRSGLDLILTNRFDLVLLDVMLPEMSGFEVCRKARQQGYDQPIVMLTAKGEEIDTVLGLELGADDYVTKPFRLRELLARVKAVLRRAGERPGTRDEPARFTVGRLQVDLDSYEALCDGERTALSHLEFELLRYLFTNRGRPVSREELLREVWGYQDSPATRTVDNFVLRLRQKIERDPATPRFILTVHGVGYKMVSPESV